MGDDRKQDTNKVKGKKRTMDLLNGTLWDKILLFALPLAATGILQQLFNAADVAVIGQFAGKTSMAAVGCNAPFIGLLVNLFVGVSIGANVVISTLIGQNDPKRISRATHTTILLALIGGVSVAIIGNLVTDPMIRLLSVPDEVAVLAARYLRIYFAGMPFIMLYNFESAIFRSKGDTKTPLIFLTISGCVNVALNLFFVIVLGMDVEGVAIATVMANMVSSSMLFVALTRLDGPMKISVRKLRIDGRQAVNMIRIGVPSGLQGMVFSVSNLVVQSAINSLGTDVMAGSSAAFNLEILGYYVVNSFGQACVTFIGQNYGAGKIGRCRRTVRDALLLNWACTIVICVIMLVFGRTMLSLFNSDPSVIDAGYIRIKFLMTAEVLNSVMETLSGAMRGLGYSMIPAVVTMIGVCGVRIAWVYTIFAQHPTMDTLMATYPVSWAVTASILTAAYLRLQKRLLPKDTTVN